MLFPVQLLFSLPNCSCPFPLILFHIPFSSMLTFTFVDLLLSWFPFRQQFSSSQPCFLVNPCSFPHHICPVPCQCYFFAIKPTLLLGLGDQHASLIPDNFVKINVRPFPLSTARHPLPPPYFQWTLINDYQKISQSPTLRLRLLWCFV